MKIKHLAYSLAALQFLVLASCSDDEPKQQIITPNLNELTYNSDNIWGDWNKPQNLTIDGFTFSHQWTEWFTSTGFVAAKISDTAYYDSMYEHQFEVITGGGVDGPGTPYLVANWNSSESVTPSYTDRCCYIARADGLTFIPESVYVTNAAYPYYSMTRGDNFSRKFVKGDKLTLNITGVNAAGKEQNVAVYLANCTSDDAESGILKTWHKVDLTPLGEVKAIYFTMTSTDIGEWGMNTPAYFAIDKFTAK
ncbi:MAG: DUF4465 domain-containing protein [Prevotella sp.]|nr:DUF4465 domain-containing protein [Bacteroides sp.]MCM1366940.1 DUF4465 domain-containing protein [Prevotella sp.]MCM1437176.1 DUF4465 domain-containing protein [Prevotella sp.]